MKTGALGIDIGGTKTAVGVVLPNGVVVAGDVRRTPASSGAQAILWSVIELAISILDEGREHGVEVVAAGVGSGGHVNHNSGTIAYASDILPGWSGSVVGEALHAALGLSVSVDNDVNSGALGEQRFGAGRGFQNSLYVTVGTGVGGAVVSNGSLLRGTTWTAGELGHLLVDWDGKRRCNCGATGHLEAYASGPAMVSRYLELTCCEQLCDLQQVAEIAERGDEVARRVIAEGARILGLALGGLLNVIDPQVLIVGGGVTELGDMWFIPFEAALRSNRMPGPAHIPLKRAELGPRAGVVGAAWMALSEHTANS